MRLWTLLRDLFAARDVRITSQRRNRPALEQLEDRCLLSSGFGLINLVSPLPGQAPVVDSNLVNPWGVALSPTGPFWIAENGTGVSDLLNGVGLVNPLVVSVPAVAGPAGSPTGVAFNNGPGFVVSQNGASGPSTFLFATLDGGIFGWSELADMSHAVLAVDNSASGAVYTGLALAKNSSGQSFVYAADVANGKIDAFDQNFKPVSLAGSFQDPNLPSGYAPFNIQNVNNLLYVTYVNQGPVSPGASLGFVDVFDTGGNLVLRLASGSQLNAPWGIAQAPDDFGSFGGDILVGNNGDGHISAYNPENGAFLGQLSDTTGSAISIPDLWALTFGNGAAGGDAGTLFFTAGPTNETSGLFGAIQPAQRQGTGTGGTGVFNPNAPGEAPNYPLPPFGGPAFQNTSLEVDPGVSVLLGVGTGNAQGPVAGNKLQVPSTLLPFADSSLAAAPTLSPFSQPRVTNEPQIAATPLAALSITPSMTANVLAAGTTLLVLPGEDAPPAANSPGDAVALNTFLDVRMASSSSTAITDMGQSDAGTDSLIATSSTAVDAGSASFAAATNVAIVNRQSSEPPAAPGVDGNVRVESRTDDDRTNELKGVLLAVGVPLLGGYLAKRLVRRPRPAQGILVHLTWHDDDSAG
jgi:uncharacterized protein (TIGR03118 family)